MGSKNCVIISLMLIICLIPFFASISAVDTINVKIHMIGQDAKTRFDSPVIVAGIWHYINVTLEDSDFQNLFLKLYKSNSIPDTTSRDETNYYEWKYNIKGQQWTDLNKYGGYSYIDVNKSEKNGDIYSFCLGIKDTFPDIMDYYENWTLEIYRDTSKQYSTNIVMEKPTVGLGKSHADIIRFHVNPFEEINVQGDDYFIIENVGNVPLIISIDYQTYNNILEISSSDGTLSAGENSNYYINLNSESWKPGILEISGFASGIVPSNLIITSAAFTFKPNVTINAADLEISVGHSNYKIKSISGSNVVFQYQEEIEMKEGEIKDLKAYISGDGIVILDITDDGENVEIIKISSENKTDTPLTIASTNTSEYEITVQVEAIKENKVGVITYELQVNGKIQTYETRITIGPPQNKNTEEVVNLPITMIVIIFLAVIIAGYMIFSQVRHKRR